MPLFRPVELVKGVKKHDRLSESYSWKYKLNEILKNEKDSSAVHISAAVPTYLFKGSYFRDPMRVLSTDIAVEVELRDAEVREVVDPSVKLAWFASVKKVCGLRVLLRWIGCGDKEGDEKYDFWINYCSANFHRVGWGAENAESGVLNACPVYLDGRSTDWGSYLMKELATLRTFQSDFELSRRQVTKCKLQVGERVELLDNQVSTRVRPAVVIRTVGRRVCVQVQSKDFDVSADPEANNIGEERQYDSEFWLDQSSFYIFHVGWAALNDYKCCARPAYLEHAKAVAQVLSSGGDPERVFAGNDLRPETTKEWHRMAGDVEVERFKAGQKLEFLDPLDTNFNKLKVGTVVRVMKDGYMIVAADGDDMENETVPFHCTASFLFPVGYAKKYGITLVPPGGDEEDSSFDWDAYLKQTRSEAAPENLFHAVPAEEEMSKYKVGACLEASDLNESHLICPAHIVSIKGRMLEIAYDGWGAEYNQLFDYRSNDIFPVGWCEAHGYKLEEPKVEQPAKKKKK